MCPDKDQQNLTVSNNLLCIDGGNCVSLTSTVRQVSFAGGTIAANGANTYVFNSTVVRTAVGRYTVTFNFPHPNGVDYFLSLTASSDDPNRDQRKIGWLNKTASSFDVITTVDDNGGAADGFADIPFDYSVFEEISILTGINVV